MNTQVNLIINDPGEDVMVSEIIHSGATYRVTTFRRERFTFSVLVTDKAGNIVFKEHDMNTKSISENHDAFVKLAIAKLEGNDNE